MIDDNECFWPQIDLNGSGQGALSPKDARPLNGSKRTDLAAMDFLWSDAATPFVTAMTAAGLSTPPEIYAVAESAPEPVTQCRRLVNSTVVATGPTQPTGTDGGTPIAATAGTTTPGETSSDAKEVRSEVEAAIAELRKTHPNLHVTINPATGLPSTVMGLSPQPGGTAGLGAAAGSGELTEEETKRAVESYFGTGGLGTLFPAKNKSAKQQYVDRRKDPDFPDRYVAEVEQRIEGVPVFGSSAKLTVSRSLGVTKFSGTTSNAAVETTTPKITEGEAVATARAKLSDILRSAPDASRAFPLAPDPQKAEVAKPELTVFDPALVGKAKGGPTRLAWLVTIEARSASSSMRRRARPSTTTATSLRACCGRSTIWRRRRRSRARSESTRTCEHAPRSSPPRPSSHFAIPASCATTSSSLSGATASMTGTVRRDRRSNPTCSTGALRMPTGARRNPTTARKAT